MLIDVSEDELLAVQERHMEKAVHNGYNLALGKEMDGTNHVEVA